MAELILSDEVYRIMGAAMDVYHTLGSGFLEPVYQQALEIELGRRRIPFEAQKKLTIKYKQHRKARMEAVCYLKPHSRFVYFVVSVVL